MSFSTASADHHWGKRGRKARGDAGELGESLPGGLTGATAFFAPLTVLQDKERTVVLHIDRVASIIKLGGDAAVDIGARDEQVQFIERGGSSPSWRITSSSSLLLTLRRVPSGRKLFPAWVDSSPHCPGARPCSRLDRRASAGAGEYRRGCARARI